VGLQKIVQKLSGLNKTAQNAGWALPHEGVCWISERHCVVNQDERGRIHCEDGPAIAYPDGFSVYGWHGVRVPEIIITKPSQITPKKINEETNAEIRRVMIERYGYGRFVKNMGAKMIGEDRDIYDRPRKLWLKDTGDEEPLVLVEVINSTAEPDGRFKTYFIPVPERSELDNKLITTPQAAVAWTFGMTATEYATEVEA